MTLVLVNMAEDNSIEGEELRDDSHISEMTSPPACRSLREMSPRFTPCIAGHRIISKWVGYPCAKSEPNSIEFCRGASINEIKRNECDRTCFKRILASLPAIHGRTLQNQWKYFFFSPSHWQDSRLGKTNAKVPDFKHETTAEALWANRRRNLSSAREKWAPEAPTTTPQGLSAYNKMLAQLVKSGQYWKTLQLFYHMQQEGLVPDRFTFVPVLSACSRLQALEQGRSVHLKVNESPFKSDVFISSSLINMYAKCGNLEDARKVFDSMPRRDVVAWNAMIQGYAKVGNHANGQKALTLFQQMQGEGLVPTRATFLGALNACTSSGASEEGQRIHAQIIRRGLESDFLVGIALLDMYSKYESTEDVQRVFRKMWSVFNEISPRTAGAWNAMIQASVKCGQAHKALELFQAMQRDEVKPNAVSYVAVLHACASLRALEEGRRIHELIIENAFNSDVFVGSSLIDMYCKCGNTEEARRVFNKMPSRNVVTWTTMIQGYVSRGTPLKALELFSLMQTEQVRPNRVTFLGILNACASLAALESGRRVHSQIIQRCLESDKFIGNALVDMYAKCGSVEDAWKVFESMPARDIVAWTAMLGGYALVGRAKEALLLFEQMCEEGQEMDTITFVCLLSACSHVGLVDEGVHLFESISTVYGVSTTVEHLACVVDLLGRAGRVHEAEDLMKTMSLERNACVLMALLGACRVHGNVEIAERLAKQVIELDPGDASGYVLLSNIYAASGDWDRRAYALRLKMANSVKKEPGCTWIEVNGQVYSFTADDQRHPQIADIHAELKRLFRQMEDAGYVPDTQFALHNVEEEEKVSHLGVHSEKLAIAFGLISTPAGTPLRIMKNLRVCGDCHTATKLISKLVHREMVVRDATRFHHVFDGHCSCNDYW